MALITEYFKIIRDGELVGTATDLDFARYIPESRRVHICQALSGQYAMADNVFYHDDWMLPVDPESYLDYTDAKVISIPKTEYDILQRAEEGIVKNETVKIPGEEISKKLSETGAVTLDVVRSSKLHQLSAACAKAIENGFSLVLSDGASHHFSMTSNDQLNLLEMEMSLAANGDSVPYHADGELTQYYGEADAKDILAASKRWKQYNLAYYNSLKNWISHLTDLETIDGITYESDIPEEYCSAVLIDLTSNF